MEGTLELFQTFDVSEHSRRRSPESRVGGRCDDCHKRGGSVRGGWCRLKGDEEVIGGFDLIYKDKPMNLPDSSMYTTMLGCKLNRQ